MKLTADAMQIHCPFVLGQRVELAPTCEYAPDWPGEYTIVSITWEYQRDRINIGIATDEEIEHGHGWTDDFKPSDFFPTGRAALKEKS